MDSLSGNRSRYNLKVCPHEICQPTFDPRSNMTIHSSKEVGAWPYSESVLAFSVLVYFFHSWLDLRQRNQILKQTAPKGLEGHLDPEEFKQAQTYQLDKW